jgi:hypothetical protein
MSPTGTWVEGLVFPLSLSFSPSYLPWGKEPPLLHAYAIMLFCPSHEAKQLCTELSEIVNQNKFFFKLVFSVFGHNDDKTD